MTIRKDKISITDIAEKFKVSVTTISFILNGKASAKKISPSLIRRVEEYVKKVGYVPASVKRKLQGGKSECIAILVNDRFFENMLFDLSTLISELGYSSIQFILKNDATYDESVLQMTFDCNINSFLGLGVLPSNIKDKLLRNGKQLFLIGDKDPVVDSLYFDYVSSSYNYFKKLFESKNDRIGYVMDGDSLSALDIRKGYLKAVDEFSADLLIKKMPTHQQNDVSLKQILNFVSGNDLQVVFLSNQKLLSYIIANSEELANVKIAGVASLKLLKDLYNSIDLLYINEAELLNEIGVILSNKLSQKNDAIINKCLSFEII